MPPSFLGPQRVDLGLELLVRRDRTGLGQDLTALDVVLLNAAQQTPDIVAGLSLVQGLVEHLDTGHHGLAGVADSDDFHVLAGLDHPALDSAGHDRAASGDGEHVLDRHLERLVHGPLGQREVLVHGVQQFQYGLDLLRVVGILHGLEGGALDNRDIVAGELVLLEHVPNLFLDQFDQIRVIDLVGLVQVHHDRRNSHLASQQDMLPGLRHDRVRSGNHQNSSVHLGGPGDHVLDVVGVAGTVHVGVVPVVGLVLHVAGVDRDPSGLLLGGVVDIFVPHQLVAVLLGAVHRDRRGKGRLAMIHVTNRPDVDVGFGPLKLCFGHRYLLASFSSKSKPTTSRTSLRGCPSMNRRN